MATPVLGKPVFLAVGVFWGDVCHMVEGPSLGDFCYLEKWEMIAQHWMAYPHSHVGNL